MIRESLADSNQIQWQVLAKSLQLQLADSRLWQVLYIYSTGSDIIYLNICSPQKPAAPRVLSQEDGREGNNLQSDGMIVQRLGRK